MILWYASDDKLLLIEQFSSNIYHFKIQNSHHVTSDNIPKMIETNEDKLCLNSF